jgi:ABC-2 type transport system ATP-binding protein
MNDLPIRVSELAIRYGAKTVVRDVTFAVSRGSVYGLLGRNGEGKTSIVSALLGQLQASAGNACLFGADAWRCREDNMARVAFVPETPQIAPNLRVADLLTFLRRVRGGWDDAAARKQLADLGIAGKTQFGTLSRGQKTQLALIAALACRPELLICDDPTLGLDAVARRELLDRLIVELAENGTTVFLTTHDLEAFAGIVDRVGILSGGRLRIDEETESLRRRFQRLELEPAAEVPAERVAALQPLGAPLGPAVRETVVAGYDEALRPPGVRAVPLSLEEIFVAVTGESEAATDA